MPPAGNQPWRLKTIPFFGLLFSSSSRDKTADALAADGASQPFSQTGQKNTSCIFKSESEEKEHQFSFYSIFVNRYIFRISLKFFFTLHKINSVIRAS